MIDRLAPTPLWRQLVDLLRARIESGELRDTILSESQLVQKYELSRGTVSKALDYLEEEGLVVRVSGRGTFVKSGPRN